MAVKTEVLESLWLNYDVRNVLFKGIFVFVFNNKSKHNPSAWVSQVHGRSKFVRFSLLTAHQELY